MPLTQDKNNLVNHAWEADNPSTIDPGSIQTQVQEEAIRQYCDFFSIA